MGSGQVVKARTRAAIEEIAAGVRTDLGFGPHQRISMTPILEQVLYEVVPGYEFQVVEDHLMGDMEGHTDAKSPTISLKASVYRALERGCPRARMTAAHELGHLMMHSMAPVRYAFSTTYNALVDPERQANIFMGALLMPRAAFIRCMTIRGAMKRFGVSRDAVLCRARNLRHLPLLSDETPKRRQKNKERKAIASAP